LFAVLTVAFLATAAFSVDVAYMNLVNAELRGSTDAAAKAAVEVLNDTEDLAAARQAAIDIAAANPVDGHPLILESSDIVFGRGRLRVDGSLEFLAGETPYGAARITGRKTRSSPSGAVTLFLGSLFGSPYYETELSATATRLNRDIAIVVDRSGSMEGQKLADLKDAVSIFLQALTETPQSEMTGLVSYSTDATIDQELTLDLNLIDTTMQTIVADGYTAIGDGIKNGQQVLENGRGQSFAEKTMILMTDGIHNRGLDPAIAARQAAQQRIVIHTITFGEGAEQARMQEVARITGGSFHHAPDGETLKQIYREVALTLRTILTE
jgi:uncharacterized protein YegL